MSTDYSLSYPKGKIIKLEDGGEDKEDKDEDEGELSRQNIL